MPASVAMMMPSKPDSAPTQRSTAARGISTATNAAIRQAARTFGRMSTKSMEVADENFENSRLSVAPVDDDRTDHDRDRDGRG